MWFMVCPALLCADDWPTHAVVNVVGNISAHEFGVSTISVDIRRRDHGASRIDATLTDVPSNIST